MSAPIETWDGAEAYFTYADSPGMIWIILALSIVACVYTITRMAAHESHSAKSLK